MPLRCHLRIAAGLMLAFTALVLAPGCAGGGAETTHPSCKRYRSPSSSGQNPAPVPLSRYVGAWQGTWTDVDPSRTGTMTLTIKATGALAGQFSGTATGETGTITGMLSVDDQESPYATTDITTTLGDRSAQSSTQVVIVQTTGHLVGSMSLPDAHLVSFDLNRP